MDDFISFAASRGALDEGATRTRLAGRPPTLDALRELGIGDAGQLDALMRSYETMKARTIRAEAAADCGRCGRPMTARGGHLVCEPCGTQVVELPPEVEEALGDAERTVGKYVRLRELGQGGFGAVWLAWDIPLSRYVALKFLTAQGEDELARFHREASVAASLSHPNIVSVYEVGETPPFIAMQFIDGRSAGKIDLSAADAARIVKTAAEAVQFAHEHGVIHRDLKPDNLMIDRTGRVYVTDFGLAKRTDVASTLSRSGLIAGTPSFMSPEQASGRPDLDGRTDVYSLGATLYAMLARRAPFEGNPMEVLGKVVHDDPPPPPGDRDLRTIVQRAMEKDPERRYRSAGDLAADIGRFLGGEPIHARPVGFAERLFKRVRREPVKWGLGVAAVALAAIAVTSMLGRSRQERRAEAMKIYQESQTVYQGALMSILLGEPAPEAMAQFEARLAEARRVDPTFEAGWFERAQYARLAGDEEAAWRHLEAGLAREPADPLGRLEHGMLLARRYERRLVALKGERSGGPSLGVSTWDKDVPALEAAHPDLRALREQAAAEIGAGAAGTAPWVRLALAQLAYLTDDVDAVERHIGTLAVAPARVLMGRIAERRGDFEKAEEWYSRAIATDDRHVEAWEARANLRLAFGIVAHDPAALDRSLADWEELVKRRPDSGVARYGLGMTRLQRGMHESDPVAMLEQARRELEEAAADETYRVAALNNAGIAAQILGDWRVDRGLDPTADFEGGIAALERVPGFAQSASNLGGLLVALAEWREGRGVEAGDLLARAEKSYGDALEREPTMVEALNGIGLVCFKLDRHREAVDFYDRAIAVNDRQAAMFHNRGNALRLLGEFDRAEESFRGAIERDPSLALAYNGLGLTLQNRGQWEFNHATRPDDSYRRAVEAFDAALKLAPSLAIAHHNRATTFDLFGQALAFRGEDPSATFEAALAGYEATLDANPEYVDAYFALAGVCRALGDWRAFEGGDPTDDYRRALRHCDEGLKRVPTHVEGHNTRGIVYRMIAEHRIKRGEDATLELEAAVAAFERALELAPAFAFAHNNLGNTWNLRAAWEQMRGAEFTAAAERALASWNKAIEHSPEMWQAMVNKGKLLASLDRWDDALRAFEDAYAIVGDGFEPLKAMIEEARRQAEF